MHLRSEVKSKMATLMSALPVDDQMLLGLRLDKRMAWSDLVRVLHDGAEPLSDELVKRESARLRKRFQLVKERLAAAAREAGIVSTSSRRD